METSTTYNFEITNPKNNKVIRGEVHRAMSKKPTPAIVVCHEHGSNCHKQWWQRFARHWCEQGLSVVLFDFIGGTVDGVSDGVSTEMSVLTEVEDLGYVLDEVQQWEFINHSKIILCGGSQGGGVATVMAGERKDDIAALVLLYPAYHLPDDLHRLYPDPTNLPESDQRGLLRIGRRYITDMYDHDYYKDMKNYDAPVLIVHGDKDEVVPMEYVEKAAKTFANATLNVIEGAAHLFATNGQQKQFIKHCDSFLTSYILAADEKVCH